MLEVLTERMYRSDSNFSGLLIDAGWHAERVFLPLAAPISDRRCAKPDSPYFRSPNLGTPASCGRVSRAAVRHSGV